MEKNKFQCPQCGAASSTKISDSVYHCTYCESNFNVEPSGEDLVSNLFAKNAEARKNLQDQLAQMRANTSPEAKAAAKKRAVIVLVTIFGFIFGIMGIVFYSVKSQFKNAMAATASNASINKFYVFSGSKGPVIWMLLEQEGSMTDSVHYLLRIINPQNKQVIKEVQFIPPMTWSDNFGASKLIGTFYSFGDTCWITSEHDVLYARDIYSGKIISTADQLGNKYTEFSKGITKAEWAYSNRAFNITSDDGFDYIFVPDAKKVFKKDDWDKAKDQNELTRTFFVLTDGKRPALFKSVEKTSLFATSSKTFSSDLENYDPKKRAWGLNDDVISISPLLTDKTFFNGFIEYCGNDKTIIMYQNSVAKKSALHISCVNADGKEVWDISGKDIKPFQDVFSDNNRGVDFVYSKNAAILFEEYGDHNAIGLDWNTGKVLWSFAPEKN